MTEPLLTSGQAALLLGVTPHTVAVYVRTGLLPAVRTPGGQYRIRPWDVLMLQAKTQARKP